MEDETQIVVADRHFRSGVGIDFSIDVGSGFLGILQMLDHQLHVDKIDEH